MHVNVLGQVTASRDGEPVHLAGGRLRTLLVRLALNPGRTVSTTALIDAVWGDEPPADAANALQSLVSRLRRSLGDSGLVRQTPGGYELAVAPDDVDAVRFERLAREGAAAVRSGDHARGADLLRSALALWRGTALADVADAEFALAPAARLADLRRTAVEDRIDAELGLGAARDLVPELEALVAAQPLHERPARQLITALYRAGRQADALAAYERLRTRLADELGVDPSAETQAAYLAVLRGEATPAPPVNGSAPAGSEPAAPRSNLRVPLSSFVGRETEVERLSTLLADSRLTTVVGVGGAGKTRLVSEAATAWAATAACPVWFVPLAPVTDPVQIPQAVLGELGMREVEVLDRTGRATPRDALSRLREALADRECVIVLDNCEHLIDAAASLADTLLAHSPGLRIVTTSREPLGLVGESLLVLPPLPHPNGAGAFGVPAAEAISYPAVRLFADRAAAVSPGFVVDETTTSSVIEICRRLDGLPLAIELAAARLRSMPVEHIAARLDDRFRLLTGGSRVAIPRHRTLRAVVEWSWDLLTPAERRLAERIAVFPAGVTPSSAAAVCADGELPAGDMLDLLASLVDKSLLQVERTDRVLSEPRYRMLETIREYGQDRLAERGELDTARLAHARHFAAFMAEAEPHLRAAEQLEWFARVRADQDNALAALRYLGDSGDAEGAIDLAGDFASYWMLLGAHGEAATWLGFALAVPGPVDQGMRLAAEAAYLVNSMAFGDRSLEAGKWMERIAEVSDELEDVPTGKATILTLIRPLVAMLSHREDRAERLLREAFSSPDAWIRGTVRMLSANMAENEGDTDRMRRDLAAGLAEFRAIGDRWGLASCLATRARLSTLDGDLDGALADYGEAMDLMAALGASEDRSGMLLRRAEVLARRGEFDVARAELRQAVTEAGVNADTVHMQLFIRLAQMQIERHAGNLPEARRIAGELPAQLERLVAGHPMHAHLLAFATAALAMVETADGNPARAAELLADAQEAAKQSRDMPITAVTAVALAHLRAAEDASELAAEALGIAAKLLGSPDPTDRDVARLTTQLRERLGDEAFDAAYARGRALDQDAALARLKL